jgi:hypothetical protein
MEDDIVPHKKLWIRRAAGDYIGLFYMRRHSTVGYLSLIEFEMQGAN